LDEDYANGAAAMIAKTLIHDRRDPEGRPNLWHLEAMRILTAPEHKPAYGPDGGFFSKPQAHDIADAICDLLDELDGGERRLY
jgi:2-oxoisovalerate dehydrogenase E1 component